MEMRCDTCERLICDPPEPSSPYGEYACGKGYWSGIDKEPDKENDPWKNCIDYKGE